ncbi:hypothetical protein [Paenibacillus validus]|uniref:hypothetical protein n=1 Tax=Paenibacillus validus TaxID=44253 RepID=UPI00399C7813
MWLIECNAQSAKVSIVKAYGAKSRRAFLNPLEYAKAIMGTDRSNTVIPSDMMYPKLSIRG